MTFPSPTIISTRQAQAEAGWLALTRERVSAGTMTCICEPCKHGARWTGYLGANYARERVLFVAAIHNGRDTGLLGTPDMEAYNGFLKTWAQRRDGRNRELLTRMRFAYKASWQNWRGVWTVINNIREAINLADDDFAFINLALCHEPEGVNDSEAIVACQESFPLDHLVSAIDARIIFFAKGGDIGRAVPISGEGESRFVWRYGNGSRGNLGREHWSAWLPREKQMFQQLIATERRKP